MARLLGILAILLCLLGAPALAQPAPAPAPMGEAGEAGRAGGRAQLVRELAETDAKLRQLSRTAARATDDDQLSDLRGQALDLQSRVEEIAARLQDRLTTVEGLLNQLGPAPSAPTAEPPAAAEARARYTRAKTNLGGLLSQAKLESTLARQTAERIVERRRQLFNQRLFTRAASPFSGALWTNIGDNLPRDSARLQRLAGSAVASVRREADAESLGLLAAALLAALLLIWPTRLWLEELGRRRVARHAPSDDLGRSGYAIWRLAVGTVTPALAAVAIRLGLNASGLLSGAAAEIAEYALTLVVWVAFVTALGRAFLQANLPAWRLPPLEDRLAKRLRPYPWLVAAVTASGALLERVNSVIGASLAATVAANCALSLAYAAVAGFGLLTIGRARIRELSSDAADGVARGSAVRGLITVGVVLAVTAAFGAALLGYFALAYLIARQILWVGILACLLYLLLRFVDDLFTALFSSESGVGRRLRAGLGVKPGTVEQLGVVGSAIVRVLLIFATIGVVLAPFGAGGGEVLGRFGGLVTGFKIGGLTLSPLGLATGIGSFLVGLWIVRAVQRWLNERYLPHTDWDVGVRASVSTTVGYLGVVVAGAWAAASMGLALQQIALIASALSVGIGFGLQAIVSNFISGLILLVERPVKVGDWIAVGDQEGDVRRINVRATEIALFDRSTLIVPNGDLITKAVRNITHGGALGRVGVRLTLAPDADPERARAEILAACSAEPAVVNEPAPFVWLDAVNDTGLVLQSFAYVASPRAVAPTRSALHFAILRRFRDAGIALSQGGPSVRVLLDERGERTTRPETDGSIAKA